MNEKKGAILIISGPSGCGKSTLLKEVYKDIDDYYFSISTTTRAPRTGEINGIDYFFVTKEEFEKDIKNDDFLEYAKVHDNYYGTSLKPINKALKENKLVIFDIDVQGHEIVRNKLDSIVTSVFITTPSLRVLEERLNSRNTDTSDIIEKRIKNAKGEVEFFQDYDYLIINDDLQTAAKQLVSIANITRIKAMLFNKEKIVSNWLF
uniref:guanylate kinase n=1 Tax=Aliarcobacter sp. TaxID=2321116 RepID=UPI0040472BF9